MMNIRSIILLSFFTMLFACSGSSYNKNAAIKGKLDNASGKTITLQRLTSQQVVFMDSTKIGDDGMFSFDSTASASGFYRLSFSQQNFVNLILEKGSNVEILGDANNLAKTIEVKGSEETNKLLEYNKELTRVYLMNDSLKKLVYNYQKEGNYQGMMTVQQEQQKLNQEQQLYVRDFITKNPGSFVSLAAIQALDPENDMDLFLKVEQGLKEKYPDSELYLTYAQKVKELKQVNIGSEAPEIELNTPEGSTLALSSLRGKVVLIDFWASWCRPCRSENPNVVRMYNKYKDKGFDIYSVSLDNNKDRWVNAIEADGLTWNHVSDLRGWQSVVVPMYKVKGIPKTYLIDAEGKIIGKDLRGASLERKLEEVLGG